MLDWTDGCDVGMKDRLGATLIWAEGARETEGLLDALLVDASLGWDDGSLEGLDEGWLLGCVDGCVDGRPDELGLALGWLLGCLEG